MLEDTGWIIVNGKKTQNNNSTRSISSSRDEQTPNMEKQSSLNTKKELTEEELEIMREKRRERRKREKENKKKLKEQRKRAEVYAPKSSKINVVSADSLLKR